MRRESARLGEVGHFCQTDVSKVSRPERPDTKKHYKQFETPKWIWACYFFIAAWWILGGAYDVMDSFYFFGKSPDMLKL